jgi:hypothetical protein
MELLVLLMQLLGLLMELLLLLLNHLNRHLLNPDKLL